MSYYFTSSSSLAIIYLITRKRQVLRFICCSVSILLVFHCCFTYYIQNRQEIVIRNLYKQSAILLNYKGYYAYLKTTSPDDGLSTYITANHLQALPTHEAFVGQQIKFIRNHLSSPQCSISIIDHTNPTFSNEDIVIITENIYPPDFTQVPSAANYHGQLEHGSLHASLAKVLSQEPNSVFQDKRSGNNYLENIGNFLWNSDYNALFCSSINT